MQINYAESSKEVSCSSVSIIVGFIQSFFDAYIRIHRSYILFSLEKPRGVKKVFWISILKPQQSKIRDALKNFDFQETIMMKCDWKPLSVYLSIPFHISIYVYLSIFYFTIYFGYLSNFFYLPISLFFSFVLFLSPCLQNSSPRPTLSQNSLLPRLPSPPLQLFNVCSLQL